MKRKAMGLTEGIDLYSGEKEAKWIACSRVKPMVSFGLLTEFQLTEVVVIGWT
jgi:hypothetical protein